MVLVVVTINYMGSKIKIVKYILPILQGAVDSCDSSVYVEPFVGGCNVIEHIQADVRVGLDANKYLIALLNNLDKLSTLPEFVTKEHYSEVRDCFYTNSGVFDDWYIGAVGFLASYNGRFFDGGYSGFRNGRNYYSEHKRNLERQLDGLKGIYFRCSDYSNIKNLTGSVVYCDPPYAKTKGYLSAKGFDYDKFWQWVRMLSENNKVFVSETSAPDDFTAIWSREVKRVINVKNKFVSCEKLFVYNKNLGEI